MTVEPPPFAELGRLIAASREAAGMSRQAELAARMDVTQQTVSRWEAGQSRPRLAQLAGLAAVLNQDLDTLTSVAGYQVSPAPGGGVTFDRPLPVENVSPETFENFVADFLTRRHPDAKVSRAGASGHAQDGIDIVARMADGTTHTFQCKRVQASFGPEKVRKAIAAHSTAGDRRHLVLSNIASPLARRTAEEAGWEVWDRDDLSRQFRQLADGDQDRLIDTYFPLLRFELTGRDAPGPWVTVERFFEPFEARAGVFSHSWALKGRSNDVAAIAAALGREKLTVVVAPGGFGKSRVLKEALAAHATSRPDLVVRFVSPTRTVSARDFEALGDREKIIAVDDAHDREDLGTLFEYCALDSNRARLVFASRPYGVERIARQAAVFGVQGIETVELRPLGKAELREIAADVLRAFDSNPQWAGHAVAIAGDSPLITVMAARIMAREPTIPELIPDKAELKTFVLGKFEKVITGDLGLPADQPLLARLMELLALVQPVDLQGGAFPELAAVMLDAQPAAVSRLIRVLVEGGVLFKRGRLHRLMPDVLGDYLIDRSCLDANGRLSPFAVAVVDQASGRQLTNAVLNLGRLDWRRNDGDPSHSDLLVDVWRRLADLRSPYDQKLDAVLAVAPYQPRQALDYVTGLLADPPGDYLPRILARIAYSGAYLEDACDLLWALGKGDDRDTGPYPNHPIRLLSELVGVERNKPFSMNEQAFEFGMRLFERPDAWGGRYSPFDVVGSILKAEGVHTTSTAKAFQWAPFVVNYDLVAPLRQRVIDKVLALLTDTRPQVARRAAQFLEQVVRPPHGVMGASVGPEVRAKYDREFAATLRSVRAVLDSGAVRPAVLVSIAKSVNWHAQYGDGEPSALAKALFAGLPDALEFRTLAALSDGWGHVFLGRVSPDTWGEDREAYVAALRGDIRAAFPEPGALAEFLTLMLAEMREVGLSENSEHVLVGALLHGDTGLARAVLRVVEADPESPLAQFASNALKELLDGAPDEGRSAARRLLDSGIRSLRQAAAWGYGGLRRELGPPDYELLSVILTDDDDWVSGAGIRAAWSWRGGETALTEALLGANINNQARLANDLCLALTERAKRPLPRPAIVALLDKFKDIRELDGHWLEEFLADASERAAVETARFFFDRVQRAATAETFSDLRPVNHGPYGHVPLRFVRSPELAEILSLAWAFLHEPEGGVHFDYHVCNMFEAMFVPMGDVVARFFDGLLDTASAADLTLMGKVLRNAPPEFVFEQKAFVIRFAERCRLAGPRVHELATGALVGAASSGVRSSNVGEASPQDLEMIASAEAVLAGLSRADAAFPIYEGIRKHGAWSVERSVFDLDDDDD